MDFHRITVNVCSRSTPNPLRAHPLHDGGGGHVVGGGTGTGTKTGAKTGTKTGTKTGSKTGGGHTGTGGGHSGGKAGEEEEEEYDEDEETLRGRELLTLVAQVKDTHTLC